MTLDVRNALARAASRYKERPDQHRREEAVRFERSLPGSKERVWDYLTRTEMLPAWFGEGTIEHRPGGTVSLMDGHIRGVVTQFQPPRFLAYTWNVFDPGETNPRNRTRRGGAPRSGESSPHARSEVGV